MKFQYVIAPILMLVALPALARIPVNLSVPSEARQGESVTVSVETVQYADCTIDVTGSGRRQIHLAPQQTDAAGRASWTLFVPENYRAHQMHVNVTVSKDPDRLRVTKPIEIRR